MYSFSTKGIRSKRIRIDMFAYAKEHYFKKQEQYDNTRS